MPGQQVRPHLTAPDRALVPAFASRPPLSQKCSSPLPPPNAPLLRGGEPRCARLQLSLFFRAEIPEGSRHFCANGRGPCGAALAPALAVVVSRTHARRDSHFFVSILANCPLQRKAFLTTQSLSRTHFSPSRGEGLRNPHVILPPEATFLSTELPPPAASFLLLSVIEIIHEGRPIDAKLRGGEALPAIQG